MDACTPVGGNVGCKCSGADVTMICLRDSENIAWLWQIYFRDKKIKMSRDVVMEQRSINAALTKKSYSRPI